MEDVNEGVSWRAFKYAAIVALGGFVFGLDAAIISGTINFISAEFDLSDIQVGAVVSAPGFGVIFALLATGFVADKWGRKRTLIYISLLYLISALWSASAQSYTQLLAARFLGGLAFTSLSLAAMYIGEIAPPKYRGKLVAMNQVNIVLGLSAAYFINYLILQASNSGAEIIDTLGINTYTWRWMLGAEILPALLWFILLLTIPRSPRWLMLKSKPEEARLVLSKILSNGQLDTHLESIKKNLPTTKESAFREQLQLLFSPSMRRVFWIGLTFAIVQQTTGINAILFYAPTVFEQLGIGTDAAFMQAVFVGLTSLVFTTLALCFIDNIGRRAMTLGGLTWAVLSLGLCAYGFNQATYTLPSESISQLSDIVDAESLSSIVGIEYSSDVSFKSALRDMLGHQAVRDHGNEILTKAANLPVNLILIGILSFIAAFQFSVGPVMWVIFSEIFSIKVRAVAIPCFAMICSVVSYLIQQFFPWQLTNMGARDIFVFYSCLSAIGLVVLYRILPETKNKSIEDIERSLVNKESMPKEAVSVQPNFSTD